MARIINDFKKEHVPCELDPEEINSFVAKWDSDLNVARKDKYILVIDLPQCFRNLKDTEESVKCTNFKTQKLHINIFGNIVPEIEIPSLDLPGWGQSLKASSLGRPAYKPVLVNFTIDSKFENYYVIYKWLDLMNNDTEGYFDADKELNKVGHIPHYSTTFTLYGLDEWNEPRIRWNYFGAFPTTLGKLDLSKRQDEELECDFGFEFSFLKMELL